MNIRNENPVTRQDKPLEEKRIKTATRDVLTKALFKNPGVQVLLGTAAPEILSAWAGDGKLKKTVTGLIGKKIRDDFLSSAEKGKKNGSDTPWSEEDLLREASALLPELVNSAINSIDNIFAAFSKLPPDERTEVFNRLCGNIDTFAIGNILTSIARTAPQEPPTQEQILLFRSRLEEFLEATDFGEISEAADRLSNSLGPLVTEAMDTLWSYPAKIICLLSTLPHGMNFITETLVKTAVPFGNLPPDVLADVIVSLLKEIKGKTLGDLINQGLEIIRKFHTGSVLIGTPGRNGLQEFLDSIYEDISETVDTDLLGTALGGIANFKEILAEKHAEMTSSDPALAGAHLYLKTELLARISRDLSREISILESLSPEELADVIKRGVSEMDPMDLTEIAYRIRDLLSTAIDQDPDILKEWVSPVREMFPDMIDAVSDMLENEKPDSPLRQSLSRLGAFLTPMEDKT